MVKVIVYNKALMTVINKYLFYYLFSYFKQICEFSYSLNKINLYLFLFNQAV